MLLQLLYVVRKFPHLRYLRYTTTNKVALLSPGDF